MAEAELFCYLPNQNVDAAWVSISDLAGAAVHRVDEGSFRPTVHSYLNRLYNELSSMSPWPLSDTFRRRYLIAKLPEVRNAEGVFHEDGEWGPFCVSVLGAASTLRSDVFVSRCEI
jgi:hypothetical protein